VPDNHLAIRAGGNQAPAIGAEADLINRAAMTIETGAQLAGRHIPAAHGLIAGTRHQLLAIRGEGQTIDSVGMTFENAMCSARLQVAQVNAAIQSRESQQAAIR